MEKEKEEDGFLTKYHKKNERKKVTVIILDYLIIFLV